MDRCRAADTVALARRGRESQLAPAGVLPVRTTRAS
jgi:hypothetical protein